jgi:beta-lactamase class D
VSCSLNLDPNHSNEIEEIKLKMTAFHSILDSAQLTGRILIYRPYRTDSTKLNQYFSNNFSEKLKLPASTFKIPNSLIALETGAIPHDSFVIKWNGEKRRMKTWEEDLTFKEAFQRSCLPCYQEVAGKIGVERMNQFLDTLKYRNLEIVDSTLTTFWIKGDFAVSPDNQIDFLERLYYEQLPLSERTMKTVKQMMIINQNRNYTLSGKTGWGITSEGHHGWFVGYLEKPEQTYFFATLVEPKPNCNMDNFSKLRKSVTMEAFRSLGVID